MKGEPGCSAARAGARRSRKSCCSFAMPSSPPWLAAIATTHARSSPMDSVDFSGEDVRLHAVSETTRADITRILTVCMRTSQTHSPTDEARDWMWRVSGHDRLSVMAPVVPDPRKIKSFRSEAAFEAWMRANHSSETEIWVKIHKK